MGNSISILNNELTLSNHARFLKKYGMYSAALYYKNLNEPVERRAARAARYNLENNTLPEYYDGQRLMVKAPHYLATKVPEDDEQGYGFTVSVEGQCRFDDEAFGRLWELCENSVERYIVESVRNNCRAMYAEPSRCRYHHGGIHNVPDIDFVLENGISAYRAEVALAIATSDDPEVRLFEEGMFDVIVGLEAYMKRYVASLEETERTFTGDRSRLRRLISALKRVPLLPAQSFYEAVVACDAVMFFSADFETGRLDHYLWPYYEKDLREGKTSPEEAYSLIRELLQDIEKRCGHPGTTHVTVGGTNTDGTAAYNALTEIIVRAVGGLRSPNVSLRVRKDMPQYIWDAVLDNISKGYAQPAIVNEELYLERLVRDYRIPYEDAVDYVFGGCAELLIQGRTMCDSTWVAFNMLDVFEHTLYNHFLTCESFDEFYCRLKDDYKITIAEMAEQINIRQFALGIHSPYIMKTLLCADCIKNAKSFTKGGARYNFDSANIYASTNTVNSLYTVKKYYEGRFGALTKEELLQALVANFEGYEQLYMEFKSVTKFGNYDEELNALAHDLTDYVFSQVMTHDCHRSNPGYTGRFMPAVILWVTWILCGERVGATPDGRVLGQPTADSCGPMQGTDTEGPTSVMAAALSLAQEKCAGTCVLNLRLDSSNFNTPQGSANVQSLFETYFEQGGSHLQINVIDPEILRAALEDPEEHRDIIVRVGGFSDNFVLLDKRIQAEVIKRTEHSV